MKDNFRCFFFFFIYIYIYIDLTVYFDAYCKVDISSSSTVFCLFVFFILTTDLLNPDWCIYSSETTVYPAPDLMDRWHVANYILPWVE